MDDPITKKFRIRDFQSQHADGRYIGIVDTGANAPVMRSGFARDEGFPVYQLKRFVPISTANKDTEAHLCAVVDVEITPPNQSPFWMKSMWYLLDSITVDILIDRRTMRLMGIDCVDLNEESYRHTATITNTLTEEDDVYWDKLLDPKDIPTKTPKTLRNTTSIGDDADKLMQKTFNRALPLTNHRQSIVVNFVEMLYDEVESECIGYSTDDTVDTFHPPEKSFQRQLDQSLRTRNEDIDTLIDCPQSLQHHPLSDKYKSADFVDSTLETEQELIERHQSQENNVWNPLDVDKPRSDEATRRYLLSVDVETKYDGEVLTVGANLPPTILTALHELIRKYETQVAQSWADCGLIEGIYMKLDLKPGSQPFKRRPYRQSFEMMREIDDQCDKLLDAGFIVPSNSEFASAVTMAAKKSVITGKLEWRMCQDYRMLNSMTVRDRYPLPNITTLYPLFCGMLVFSALDLRHGYHHLEIRPEDRHKTAFITHSGLYEWVRMGFGFVNAPATFQRAMDYIFRNHSFVIVYIDDILILSRSVEEHLEHLTIVFALLQKYNLKIRIGKCSFFQSQLKYLGFILSGEGVRPDPDYVRRLWELKSPSIGETVNKKAMMRLIGMIQWLHRYIPRLSDYLAPITELTHSKGKLIWSSECDSSLNKIKELIHNAPLLRHPDLSRKFYVVTDASDIGVGSVLMQKYDDVLEPCEYWSRKFQDSESRWHVSEKELAAIVYSLEKWEKYLLGPHFVVFTDHRNLVELHKRCDNNTTSNSKLNRWFVRIEQFDFTALYIKGILNVAADYLSRDALMEGAQHHIDRNNPNRSLAAKPLRGKRHSFFVDMNQNATSSDDGQIRVIDCGAVKSCYVVHSTNHHVNALRRSPRIAAKQRALRALRESAEGAAVARHASLEEEAVSSHFGSPLTSSGVSRGITRRNPSALLSGGPSGTDVDVDASRAAFQPPDDAVVENSLPYRRRVVVTGQAADGNGDVVDELDEHVVTTRSELDQHAETQTLDDEDENVDDEWNHEITRMQSSEYQEDRDIARLFDTDYSDLINQDTLRRCLLNDAITCCIIKILEEGADVLKISLPRSYQQDVTKGAYSMKNGLL